MYASICVAAEIATPLPGATADCQEGAVPACGACAQVLYKQTLACAAADSRGETVPACAGQLRGVRLGRQRGGLSGAQLTGEDQ